MFGILNVYKPKGMTSHDVVSFVRRKLHMKRVGHTGTLDPMAEGVLPILIGKATKLSDMIMADEKRYLARVRLGIVTDTDDVSGVTLETKEVSVDEEEILKAVDSFIGEIDQIPPMYSAIKVNGQKLYQLARKGASIERKPRKIHIFSAEVSNFDGMSFNLSVHCSKGTYIRALCRDIGEKLGTGAAMESLVRTQSGMFSLENANTLESIEQASENGEIETLFISVEDVLSDITKVSVDEKTAEKIKNGLRLRPAQLQIATFCEGDRFRIYNHDALLAILKVVSDDDCLVLAIEKSFY